MKYIIQDMHLNVNVILEGNTKIFDQNENRIGKIVDVVPIQGNDVLLIDTNLGQKMVPFAKQLILFFDKNSKKLVMTLHKGILE